MRRYLSRGLKVGFLGLAAGCLAAGAFAQPKSAPFGPGQLGTVAMGAAGGDSVLDSPEERFSVRFTALHGGPLTDFSFGSTMARGFGPKDAGAFVAELYADDQGKPGVLLGTAAKIAFTSTGPQVRSVTFPGITVNAGQTYHLVVRSNPANPVSGGKSFSINCYNLARDDAPKLDAFDMSTPNPGVALLRSGDNGANWAPLKNVVPVHTVTIGGAKQGWGYSSSDDLYTFKTATQTQYIAQTFTYHTVEAGGTGDVGWVVMGLRAQNGLANQALKIVFRLTLAADSSVVAEKTDTVQFASAAVARIVAMDFSGTKLKDGEKYVLFAGLADPASQSPDDYLFSRAYAGGLADPGLEYDWQGPGAKGSRAWYSADSKTLSPNGFKGTVPRTVSDSTDLGFVLNAPPALVAQSKSAGGMGTAAVVPLSKRGVKICVAADAPEAVCHAADAVLAAVPNHPLLSVLSDGVSVTGVTDTKTLMAAKKEERAFHHLVLIGLPSDPVIAAAWQHEARLEPGGMYIFGYGHLKGDIGYIESDRNPFLHSEGIATAPYETEIVTLTGNTPAGLTLAVDAFLKKGLVNGVIAAPGWTRPSTTVLDHDPLTPDFAVPTGAPATIGGTPLVGLTPGGEDEYRGVLEDTGVEPAQIWRAKYYVKGAWNGAGAASAFDDYSNGLHRRAYGNTLWMATFASAQEAAAVAPKIAAAAKLNATGNTWSGNQPPYANGTYAGERPSSGGLRLWTRGNQVLMSTLPPAETNALVVH